MKNLIFLILLLFPINLLGQQVLQQTDKEELPLIEEDVDEIIILRTVGNQYARVVFIRNNAVLATRLLLDDMIWNVTNRVIVDEKNGPITVPCFQLSWQDYSIADRIINAPRFSLIVTEHDPTQSDRCGPWWCQFRNMRDLKQP